MAQGEPIGSARIDFVGNTDQLKQSAQEAKAVAKATAAEAERISAGGEGVFGAKKDVGKILGVVGSIGAVAGAVDSLLHGIGEFNNASATLAENLRGIREGLSFDLGPSGLEGQLNKIESSAARKLAEVEQSQSSWWSSIGGFVDKGIQKLFGEGDPLEQQRQVILEGVAGAKKQYELLAKERDEAEKKSLEEKKQREDAADARAYHSRVKSLDSRIAQEVEMSLEGEQKIGHEVESKIIEIDEMRKSATDAEVERLNQLESVIRANGERQKQAFRDAEQKKRDEADRTAQLLERAMTRALQNITAAANQQFNPNNVESSLGAIISKIDLIAQQLQRQG